MWSEVKTSSGFVPSPDGGRYGSARPTYAEIDLDAIAHNLDAVRRVAGSTQIYAVVKADAYGHGLQPVARRLEAEGVDGVCVALAEEGFLLRDAQVEAPILVLNGAYGHSHAEVLRAGLTPVIYDLHQAEAFAKAAPTRPIDVHLKVDTGMARLGVQHDKLDAVLSRLSELKNIRIVGLMTHLSSADSDPEFTALQCGRFERAVVQVRAAGYRPSVLHVANSAGTYASLPGHYGIARVGLALYGVAPTQRAVGTLKPAMRVRTEVLSLRTVPEGTPVGYNGAFVTRRTSRLATVPIGYGDGFLRASGNRGAMLIRGVLCPIVGRVSMDLTSLDVTDLPQVEIGDEVVVLGEQHGATLSASMVADAAGTIPYEVLCNLSTRVPRIYRP